MQQKNFSSITPSKAAFDDAMRFSQSMNNLMQENMLLKSKIEKMESELSKKTKLINGLSSQMLSVDNLKETMKIKKKVINNLWIGKISKFTKRTSGDIRTRNY